MCNASKGAADISMVFTDTRENARWRTTYYQDKPWDLEPPYGQLIGFDLKMVVGDLLHVYNLGIARDVIGCSLKTIIKDNVVFHAGDINERFRAATLSLRDFARAHGHSLKLKKLTKNKIQWESKKYPEFKGSGSDAHVTSIWLESVITPFADQYSDLLTLLWSTNHAMRLLYNGDRFLSARTSNGPCTGKSFSTNLHETGQWGVGAASVDVVGETQNPSLWPLMWMPICSQPFILQYLDGWRLAQKSEQIHETGQFQNGPK